jgi:transcriptional regulator with XRE-family HTH domain
VARLPRPTLLGMDQPPSQRLRMQTFARKLHAAMTARGMSQSDLARAAFGEYTNAGGYTVAKNRDRVSVYLAGKSLPDAKNLELLAKALDMPVEELAPPEAVPAAIREAPSLVMEAIPDQQGLVQLRLNKVLPLELAAKIVAPVGEHEKAKA